MASTAEPLSLWTLRPDCLGFKSQLGLLLSLLLPLLLFLLLLYNYFYSHVSPDFSSPTLGVKQSALA